MSSTLVCLVNVIVILDKRSVVQSALEEENLALFKMGALLSVGSMACCCGSAACSLCCAACPSCKNSTSSRIMYALLLLVTMIVSSILLAPGLQDALRSVPFCKDYHGGDDRSALERGIDLVTGGQDASYQVDCKLLVGHLAVYRYSTVQRLHFTTYCR